MRVINPKAQKAKAVTVKYSLTWNEFGVQTPAAKIAGEEEGTLTRSSIEIMNEKLGDMQDVITYRPDEDGKGYVEVEEKVKNVRDVARIISTINLIKRTFAETMKDGVLQECDEKESFKAGKLSCDSLEQLEAALLTQFKGQRAIA